MLVPGPVSSAGHRPDWPTAGKCRDCLFSRRRHFQTPARLPDSRLWQTGMCPDWYTVPSAGVPVIPVVIPVEPHRYDFAAAGPRSNTRKNWATRDPFVYFYGTLALP